MRGKELAVLQVGLEVLDKVDLALGAVRAAHGGGHRGQEFVLPRRYALLRAAHYSLPVQ